MNNRIIDTLAWQQMKPAHRHENVVLHMKKKIEQVNIMHAFKNSSIVETEKNQTEFESF